MTDEMGGMGHEESPAPAGSGGMTGKMTQAEQLVGLGALLILFVDLLGDIILQEYFVNTVGWIAAVGAVVVIWAARMRGMKMPVPYTWVLAVLGFAALILGVRELIDDLRYEILDDGTDIILALISYAGAVLMGLGAFRLAKSR